VTTLPGLVLALTLLAGLLGALGLAIVLRRAWRERETRRAAGRSEEVRPTLLALLAADEPDPSALRTLASLDRGRWRILEPTVVTLLGKVRGGSRDALVALLTERGVVDRALRDTWRRGAVRRCRAAEMLGSLGSPEAVPALVRLLGDHDPEVRLVSARALGRAERPEAASALLAALTGPRAVPPRVVSRALARLGTGAEPALVSALRHEDAQVRAVATEILGLVGAVGSVPALAAAVRREPSLEVRVRAARALGRVGLPAGVGALSEAAASPEVELRTVVARALGEIGTEPSVPVLTALLDDPAHPVAHNAAGALARCGPAGLAVLREAARVADDTDGASAPPPRAAHAREALAHAERAASPSSGGLHAPARRTA